MSTHPEGSTWVWRNRYDHAIVLLITVLTLGFPQVRFSSLFVVSGALTVDSTEGGASAIQLVYGLCMLLAAYLAWSYQRQVLRSLLHGGLLIPLFIILCTFSTLWSAYPIITLKRFVQLDIILLIGLLCALPPLRTVHLRKALLITLTGLLVVSAIFSVFLPQYSVSYELDNAWRGVLWQKNTLGAAAACATLVWVDVLCNRHGRSWWAVAGIAFAVFMLIMSKSSTSLVSTVLAVALYVAIRYAGIFSSKVTALALLGLACVALFSTQLMYTVTGNLPSWESLTRLISAAVGKGSDLTGRTEVWDLLWQSISQHTWLGSGYGAFWVGPGGPAQYIADYLHWMPTHAHNGYLDILNELGIVGLVLLISILLMHTYKLVQLSRLEPASAALHFSLLVMLVVSNFSESHLLYGITFQNCLFIYSAYIVANTLAELKQKAHEPQQLGLRQAYMQQ